ncbi:sugar phosphate isomerase/epimerase [Oscillatoriales cyanobacterium LEGE 11467]|uniref:Sugar phosphate isomerase/epimerase n=1 Tax=Zarconia navalis LEGE 11467 TaxID=1828826 RepID=A0A928VYF8_9CYAN|nr:sugar phosphate isomerase/epimerase family protein [Zarconia navalis]MBE9040040.1 sugar phosphate isomerase/epimerase [Zarconia navalis LEGE 11467]
MKISISNIAWQNSEEESIADLMQTLEIRGVEIAPTKIWSSPLTASDTEIDDYKQFWNRRGIQIVSMQALLYGQPDLKIFENGQNRQETLNYLTGIIQLGEKLGVRVLVFGSPKNRRIENLNSKQAEKIARDFFFEIGEIAQKHHVTFCIEPNPILYSCNFINTSTQGLQLVNAVGNVGFGLHLDSAGMTLSEEDIEPAIASCADRICHFHVSEPYLGNVGTGIVEHRRFAKALKRGNYQGWTSVEMKAQETDSNYINVENALKTALKYYG